MTQALILPPNLSRSTIFRKFVSTKLCVKVSSLPAGMAQPLSLVASIPATHTRPFNVSQIFASSTTQYPSHQSTTCRPSQTCHHPSSSHHKTGGYFQGTKRSITMCRTRVRPPPTGPYSCQRSQGTLSSSDE